MPAGTSRVGWSHAHFSRYEDARPPANREHVVAGRPLNRSDMRKALLVLLMLPLLGRVAVQPGMRQQENRLLSFPLDADPAPAAASDVASVMLMPLGENPDAFSLTAPEGGVTFDIDGDGDRERVAWTEAGAEVAFLALDANGDGRITSGHELFGSHTMPGVTNGCNALLHTFETSGAPRSGSVHSGHRLYRQLLLWVDRNHDGESQSNELRPASELFTAIGLGFGKVGRWDAHGNRVRWEGWMQRRTGGPDQDLSSDPADERLRRRHYYEVVLGVR